MSDNKSLAILFRKDTLTIVYGNKSFSIDRHTRQFDDVVSKLSELDQLKGNNVTDEEKFNAIKDIIDRTHWLKNLESYGFTLETTDGTVNSINYKGIELPTFTQKILLQMTYDNTISIVAKSVTNFFDKVLANPDMRIKEQLFGFLERANLPLLTNGNFLAYKVVNKDLLSIHDMKTKHVLGQYVEMKREDCDSDPTRTCSTGLHFCSEEYIPYYMSVHRNDKVLMLEIDPKDVVSIPIDYDFSKGRACRYLIKSVIEPKAIPGLSVVDEDRLETVSVDAKEISIIDENGNEILKGAVENLLSKEAFEKYKSLFDIDKDEEEEDFIDNDIYEFESINVDETCDDCAKVVTTIELMKENIANAINDIENFRDLDDVNPYDTIKNFIKCDDGKSVLAKSIILWRSSVAAINLFNTRCNATYLSNVKSQLLELLNELVKYVDLNSMRNIVN